MLFLSCIKSFSKEIPDYEDFSKEKSGFVVKLNGDTINGNFSILEPLPSVYIYDYIGDRIRIIMSPKNKINIFLEDLKFIQYGNDGYKVITLSSFPYGTFIAKLIDSFRIVNIYKAYEFVLKNNGSPFVYNKIPSMSVFNIKLLYVIQIGNLQPEVFYSPNFKSYPYTIRDMDFKKFEPEIVGVTIGLNYKKRLKDLFYYKPDVYAYVKSLKSINYDQLPIIVSEINKMYK